MTAYYSVTIRALPLLPLFFKEFVHPFVSDVFQVLNHAHVVSSSVTFIEGFQPAAWEVLAFITEPYQSFPNQVTMMSHENTILAPWQTTGAVCPPESFLVQVNLHGEVTDTYSAVHPARGY